MTLAQNRLRIGAVSYLNTKPLVFGLADAIRAYADLEFAVPSRLADDLVCGTLDVGLIPVIEFLRNPNFSIASNACIACEGPVWSVRVLFRKPPAEVSTLAIDEGSRTSVVLAQILIYERLGIRPKTVPFPLSEDIGQCRADAMVVIGDRAMHVEPYKHDFVAQWDLGQEWLEHTGLPFMFAAWVASPTALQHPHFDDLCAAFENQREIGLANVDAIARDSAPQYDLPPAQIVAYLTRFLSFTAGDRQARSPQAIQVQSCTRSDYSTHQELLTHDLLFPINDNTKILDSVLAGQRLTFDDALLLMQSHDLAAIGAAADTITRRLHPEPIRTYNIDRNINYTNICTAVCDFCAFYRGPKSEEGYVLSREELLAKISEARALGANQILLQGGLHPSFKLDWYEDMLRDIKREFPDVNVHGFSPPELHHFTKVNRLSLEDVLRRLRDAGLGSIPGGGAEILVDRVRQEITRGKVLTDDWLNVMRVWHRMGGNSTATMMFGHVETLAERIEHLERIRQLQDETGGFTAFICWTFQPDHTELAHIPPAGSYEYLKTQAIARLYLDNVPNIQSSWVTQGLKIGQLALGFGANDMGSLMLEENVVAEAGTVHYLTLDQIRGAIVDAGYTPRQRDVFYKYVDTDWENCAVQANREYKPQATKKLPVLS